MLIYPAGQEPREEKREDILTAPQEAVAAVGPASTSVPQAELFEGSNRQIDDVAQEEIRAALHAFLQENGKAQREMLLRSAAGSWVFPVSVPTSGSG